MHFLTLYITILFLQLKIYLNNSFVVDSFIANITITNKKTGYSHNYNLEFIPIDDKIILNEESNEIVYSNNIFYYLSYNDTKWKDIISTYRNLITIYCEDINTYLSKIEEITKHRLFNNKIKNIIIGCDPSFDQSDLILYNQKSSVNFYITREKDDINKHFFLSTIDGVFSTIYFNFYYSGDVIADILVISILFFLFIFIIIWIIIHQKARKNGQYLFIHSYILVILIIYFCHTLLYTIITFKKKYQYFDEENYSGALYNIFNFFQFFTKLLPGLCTTIQINLLELREHYRIIRNSKVIHILSVNIFFIISMENGGENLSLILNDLLYIINVICLIYMFMQFKHCLEEKILDAIIDEPDNVPTLKYKKKLLSLHSLTIIFFVGFYFIIKSIIKLMLREYLTIKFIITFINYSDLLLLFFIIGIYFPKKLPPLFVEPIILEFDVNENNAVENDYFENIYAYDLTDEEKFFEDYKIGESSDIVIIENPYNKNKIEVLMEQDEEEEEEEEEKEIEEKEKDKIKDKDKIENLDNRIETTEEDSNDINIENNENGNNIINNIDESNNKDNTHKKIKNENDDNNQNNQEEINQNNEEEHNSLVDGEEKKVINKICLEEDILDLHRTKLGYIEIS